jgi:serine/alanine adding enzyme
MICVRDIEPSESDLWNRFVSDHPRGAVTHLYQWKLAVENAYALQTRYLGAFDEGELIAVLPTIVIHRPFAQRTAISLAFAHYAGWLMNQGVDRRKVGRLFLEALAEGGVHKLELRQLDESGYGQSSEVTMERSLVSPPNALWDGLDSQVRNKVRKATKSGLLTQWGKEQYDEFYSLYVQNCRLLGSPVHSRVFFRELLDRLPLFCDILTIRLEGEAIAAMLLLGFKDRLSDPWSASLRRYHKLRPNMLIYWEALRYGCESGYTVFDMGRSRLGSGTYEFKRQWGTKPVALEYSSISLRGASKRTSMDAYRSSSGKIGSTLWKALPLPITTWLGPRIRKYIP